MPAAYWPQTILLHDHMDGSRPLLTVLPELARLSGVKYPFDQWANHHEQIIKWFGNPLKGDIVKKFSVTTGVMQDIDTLYLAAKTYVQLRANQGFKYCEATIAPQYHTFAGLAVQDVIHMFRRAKQLGWKTACHVSEWVHDPDTQEPDFFRDLPQLLKNIRTAVFNLEIAHALPHDLLMGANGLTAVLI